MIRFLTLAVLSQIFFINLLGAQPANDNCTNATPILTPTSFCTGFAGGSNIGATSDANIPAAGCMPGSVEDVWYTFQAVASSVVITVNGASFNAPGGDTQQPSMALYSGDCGSLSLITCVTDVNFTNFIQYTDNNLVPGQLYYIRVDNSSGIGGTFDLCILNFNPVPPPNSDCPTGVPICSTDPFIVEAVSGVGNDPNELSDALCFGTFGESSSTWYTFTAATSGSLTFSIAPTNPGDDLDFALYSLPNGVGDCSGKVLERCMAAGGFDITSPCMGPTGLQDGQIDISNQSGCVDEQNNFLAPLDVVAGQAYAIIINNFTSTASGFSMSWGGTATFTAPEVSLATDITQDTICTGTQVTFTETIDYDTSITTINDIYWFFGTGATPVANSGAGPQVATYDTPGSYIATMTVNAGCYITLLQSIIVEQCCATSTVSITSQNVGCFGQNDGTATASMASGVQPFTYEWSDGQTTDVAVNLAAGTYSVTVTDDIGCTASSDVTITEPTLLSVAASPDDTINLGETITLSVSSNTDSTNFIWTGGNFSGTGSSVTVSPTETTTYYVVANNNNCIQVDTVVVFVDPVSLRVPNSFSPNADNLNESFGPLAVGVQILTFRVWDRWGAMLHDNPQTAWDGTNKGNPMPSDAYLFYIVARFPDGTEKKIEGDVTLIR